MRPPDQRRGHEQVEVYGKAVRLRTLPSRGQHAVAAPEKPMDRGRKESFDERPPDECLSVSQVLLIADATEKSEAWWIDYNRHLPHGSVVSLTLSKLVQTVQGNSNWRPYPYRNFGEDWLVRHPPRIVHRAACALHSNEYPPRGT